MESLLVVGLICGLVLLFVSTTVVLRVLERLFPAFSRWLDRHFGVDGMGW